MNRTKDVTEWTDLAARLEVVCPEKHDELLEALRQIVETQETIARFDWQLLFGTRPSKRYMA